ncbi:hypothetical protein MBCUT_13460 [Methanobrevibacter cuticularis]|uniref:Gins51 C-terminal domain-containing protein n=1 Tax=Methanobrevibacter cuticularis TaxID=47311 RepID=A0A166DKS0_9EURY|nr:hypothetical protein [Methanobrevibacter cuticularis]KZX15696.1 hypothetical protein MBCUT_13460 [Methanobrevibacter cuticularis]
MDDEFYKFLREIQKKERANSSLARVGTDFHRRTYRYIEEVRSVAENDIFSSENDLLKNIQRVATEITELREHKIADAAVMNIHRSYRLFKGKPKFDLLDTTPLNLTGEEEKLYFSFIDMLKNHRRGISFDELTSIEDDENLSSLGDNIRDTSLTKENIDGDEVLTELNKIKKAKVIENETYENIDKQINKSKYKKIESKSVTSSKQPQEPKQAIKASQSKKSNSISNSADLNQSKESNSISNSTDLNQSKESKSVSNSADLNQSKESKSSTGIEKSNFSNSKKLDEPIKSIEKISSSESADSLNLKSDNTSKKNEIAKANNLKNPVEKSHDLTKPQSEPKESKESKPFNIIGNEDDQFVNIEELDSDHEMDNISTMDKSKETKSKSDKIVNVMVLIFSEINSIIGVDKKAYGPFQPQDIVIMPDINAEILIKNRSGRLINLYRK